MTRPSDISSLLSTARRHAAVIALGTLSGGLVAALYLATTSPLYTASAQILIEQRQLRPLRDGGASALSEGPMLDPAVVESQAEVLRSEDVSLAVVRKLKLTEADKEPSGFGKTIAAIRRFYFGENRETASSKLARELAVMKSLSVGLHVSRVAHTNILQLEFSSPDPVKAADIANAFAAAYIDREMNWRMEAMQHTQGWLQTRNEELRHMAADADRAVQQFRADHNLLSANGVLVSEQQFEKLSTELGNETAATAQARARYERIKEILDRRDPEATVTEALNNTVINELRIKYLDAARKRADLERRLGPNHKAIVNLRQTMEEINRLLFDELARIAQSYKSEYEVAASREKALASRLAQQRRTAIVANEAQVQLHELEQKAESYKNLYQSYTHLQQEAAQQKGFPLTTGHVVSAANPPLSPSAPRKALVLAICLGIGALAGVGIAASRDALDRSFRTSNQITDELGLELIGMLPVVSEAATVQTPAIRSRFGLHQLLSRIQDLGRSIKASLREALEELKSLGQPAEPPPEEDDTAPAALMRHSIDFPYSRFAETLRSARVMLDQKMKTRGTKVIGMVSFSPDEGKTVVAKNLASLLARQGSKVLLIDADLRSHGLTRSLEREILELHPNASDAQTLKQTLWREPGTGLHILPCNYVDDDAQIAEGLSPETLLPFLQNTERNFDYVVIDFPPIGLVPSALGLTPMVDAFVLVVRWGVTPRAAIKAALKKEQVMREKMLGAILNCVEMEELALYEPSGSQGYYLQDYNVYSRPTRKTVQQG